MVGLILVASLVGWQSRHLALWAYNLQRADHYRASAITYPAPRYSDSLPTLSDAAANERALGHLAAAIRRRPSDPFAYRLAGESYLAAGDWARAVDIMETGVERSGGDILLAWQLALAHEQIHEQLAAAPGTDLVPLFAEAPPDAPALRVETPYCEDSDARACYRGVTTFTLPYAAFPEFGDVTARTLFLHPPARLTIPVTIPEGEPALTFLMGLTPEAREWGTDGATFQVWVVAPGGGPVAVYERTVIGGELTRGWVPDSVDLGPWAGQKVEIALGTTAGPLEDDTGDWVGFGNVFLTDRASAAHRALMPEGRFGVAVAAAPMDNAQLVLRGDEALYASRFEEARRWYRRAEWAGADTTSTLAYATFLETNQREGWNAAFPHLENAVREDRGWGGAVNRFYAFQSYGRQFVEAKNFITAEGYLLVTLAIYPDPAPGHYPSVAESHRLLSMTYVGLQRFEEALAHAREAVRLRPESHLNQYQLGIALFGQDPSRAAEAQAAFDRSLLLNGSADNWQAITRTWLRSGDDARAKAYCRRALELYTPEQLSFACWQGQGQASAALYAEYLQLLESGDAENAYARLQEATEGDGGWADASQRYEAWLAWFRFLLSEERLSEAVDAGQLLLTIVPTYVPPGAVLLIHTDLAAALVAQERYEEALVHYEAALQLGPSPYLYLDYAQALYNANPADIASVRAAFEEALSRAPRRGELRIRVIDFWYSEGVEEEAAPLCAESDLTAAEDALCVRNGISSGAAFERYLATMSDGADTDAFADLEEAVTLDGGWWRMGYRHRAWDAWGRHLQSESDFSGAISAYEKALAAVDPLVNGDELSPVAQNLGVLYGDQGRVDEAIAAFELAIDYDPANVFAYINLARALYGKDPSNRERARGLMQQAIDLDPENAGIWRTVVGFWRFVEEPEEITYFCGRATGQIRNQLGDLCLVGGDPSRDNYFTFNRLRDTDSEAAYIALEAAITTDLGWASPEQRFSGWYFWGEHLLATQRPEEAVEALEFAVSIETAEVTDREKSQARRAWASALDATGDSEAALVIAADAAAVDPAFAFAHVLNGQLLFKSGRLTESEAAFAQALAAAPDNGLIWSMVAQFWLQNDELALVERLCGEAPAAIEEEISLFCWDGDTPSTTFYDEYLRQREAGNDEAALAALEQAVEVDGGWPHASTRYLAWRAWGGQLRERGELQEAIVALQTAIAAAPRSVDPELLSNDYFNLALTFNNLGNTADALAAYVESLALNPENAWARVNYGYTLYLSGPADKTAAIEQINIALDLAPDVSAIWEGVIGFWERNGETAELGSVCERAAETPIAAELAPLCAAP